MAKTTSLIFSSLLPAPPPPPKPAVAVAPPHLPAKPSTPPNETALSTRTHRRSASILLLSIATLAPASFLSIQCPSAAAAFSLGIPGPKDWLRDQKKKASRFLLVPIDASRRSLQSAYLILTTDSGSPTEDIGEIRKLLSSASRDCVPEERNSIVAFQARSGVEVCTFRLLVKNAASLLDDRDPVKLETEAMLDELIRSFASLGDVVDDCDLQLVSDRQKVVAGVKDTMSALDSFEEGIKLCLGN